MNNGKKKGWGPNLGPSPHLESSKLDRLLQNGWTRQRVGRGTASMASRYLP